MVKKVDSDALGILTKALGLTGAGSPITELADGVVDQVLSVNEIARRSRTQADLGGIYTGILENNHLIADTVTTSININRMAADLAIPPFPDPMPPQFDVWLLGATLIQLSGSGTLQGALMIRFANSQQGFGVNQAGAAVVDQENVVVASWDIVSTILTTFGLQGGVRTPFARIGMRLPRHVDTRLQFTTISSAAVVFSCQLLMGVFPVALGQDVLI